MPMLEEDTPCEDCGAARTQSPYRFCAECMLTFRRNELVEDTDVSAADLTEALLDPAGVSFVVFRQREGRLICRVDGANGKRMYLPASKLLSPSLLSFLDISECLAAPDAETA